MWTPSCFWNRCALSVCRSAPRCRGSAPLPLAHPPISTHTMPICRLELSFSPPPPSPPFHAVHGVTHSHQHARPPGHPTGAALHALRDGRAQYWGCAHLVAAGRGKHALSQQQCCAPILMHMSPLSPRFMRAAGPHQQQARRHVLLICARTTALCRAVLSRQWSSLVPPALSPFHWWLGWQSLSFHGAWRRVRSCQQVPLRGAWHSPCAWDCVGCAASAPNTTAAQRPGTPGAAVQHAKCCRRRQHGTWLTHQFAAITGLCSSAVTPIVT
jgi:hypothetical protein